jgi:2'-5' RNA ligase
MTVKLDPGKVQATLDKNQATSFGLTLVIGLPCSQPICNRATQLQAQIEALLPGRCRWYAPDHLHATVMAPLRGRYRADPPLQRPELPGDLDGFAAALNRGFAALQPFPLELDRLLLASNGLVLALGPDPGHVRQQVAQYLAPFPDLDPPQDSDGWHVTLGHLETAAPFATTTEQSRFETGWRELQKADALGRMTVEQVWLVHYANRTLTKIIGRVPLLLGRPNARSADVLLDELRIG